MTVLRRYTNLAATIHLLKTQKITLLNPGTWDDRNDAYFMAEYKRRKNLKTLLALCFSNSRETYHHWRVFSNGPDGVKIEFDKTRLMEALKDQRITAKKVKYRTLASLQENQSLCVNQLPFLKRSGFKHEAEFRFIYEEKRHTYQTKSFRIDLESIQRITLSPWIARSISPSVIAILKSIDGCESIRMVRSTLIDNEAWQELAPRAADSRIHT